MKIPRCSTLVRYFVAEDATNAYSDWTNYDDALAAARVIQSEDPEKVILGLVRVFGFNTKLHKLPQGDGNARP